MRVPLDRKLTDLVDVPYTQSFVARKRIQIDNFHQLPKEKRPTEKLIWEATSEEIDEFLDKVFDHKSKSKNPDEFELFIDNVEG